MTYYLDINCILYKAMALIVVMVVIITIIILALLIP